MKIFLKSTMAIIPILDLCWEPQFWYHLRNKIYNSIQYVILTRTETDQVPSDSISILFYSTGRERGEREERGEKMDEREKEERR